MVDRVALGIGSRIDQSFLSFGGVDFRRGCRDRLKAGASDEEQPRKAAVDRTSNAHCRIRELFSRQRGPERLERVERLVLRQAAEADAAEDFLVELRQPQDRAGEPEAAIPMAAPVETESPHDSPQPGCERRGSVFAKAMNSPEVVTTQSFADEEEAIAGLVRVTLEEVDDLENQRGPFSEKTAPGGVGILCLLRDGRIRSIQGEILVIAFYGGPGDGWIA